MANFTQQIQSLYVQDTLNNIKKETLNRANRDRGLYLCELIRSQTSKGKDPQGSRLTPAYRPAYRKYKKRKGKYTGVVNMRFSNKMLNSLKYFPTKSSVQVSGNTIVFNTVIGYASDKQGKKAAWQREGTNTIPSRPFDVIQPNNPLVQRQFKKINDKYGI